jgi:protein TonB
MVFQGRSPERNSGVNPDLSKPQRPGSPAPGQTVPAVPPTPAAPPPVAFLPPPPPPPPPPPAAAAPRPAVALPAPPKAPTSPTAPAPEPAPLAMAIPRPPPIPAIPSPPATPRTAPARPERRPERAPAFPTPLNFSFGLPGATGPRTASPSRAPATPATPARPGRPGTIDLSFGPIVGGSLSPSSSVQMEGVAVSTDWLNLVSAWWQRHSYYPPQAGMNQEEGDVTLHMRVDHDGRVEGLELIAKSGSQWLDLGAQAIFRDAHLPPLPSDMPDAQIPFHVTIHYIIVR